MAVWVEKYRPESLDEVIGQDTIVESLSSYVSSGEIPNMIFSGSAGIGKTTCAHALAKDLYGESWSDNFTELNASDERGIDVVRNQIKEFARTSPARGANHKIIFLDEADALTRDAQPALRRTMEIYSQTCRFILSCNYSSNIIEPIQSRCAVFRFSPVEDEPLKERLKYIAKQENLEITQGALDALAYVAQGDMRRAINSLQAASALDEKIDEEVVYKTTSTAKREDIRNIISKASKGDFHEAREKLEELLQTGVGGGEILEQMYRNARENEEMSDAKKVELIDKIGEIEYRIVRGSDEKIQLEALIASLSLENS